MSVIRQLIKSLLTSCVSHKSLIVRGPRSKYSRPRLALSFDDGPNPVYTSPLLDLLDDLNLRATFFVIGNNAEQHPELIQRMATAGHEIANHTYSHSDPRSTSPEAFIEEVRRTDHLLAGLTGRVPSTVRPPKGELNWAKMSRLWKNEKTVALWNVDPKDYRMTTTEQMIRWCHRYSPADGDIILLHDNHPFAIHAVKTMASNGVFEQFETTTISQFAMHSNKPIPHLAAT